MFDPASNCYYAILHNRSKSRFCARSHLTFLFQQLPQHHRWPAARPSRRRSPSPPAASSIANDLAPWCRLGCQATDATAARRGRRANAEDAVVVLRSSPVALAPLRHHPPSPPASLSIAASARTRRPSWEACTHINSAAMRPG